jgi:hypothetical protein
MSCSAVDFVVSEADLACMSVVYEDSDSVCDEFFADEDFLDTQEYLSQQIASTCCVRPTREDEYKMHAEWVSRFDWGRIEDICDAHEFDVKVFVALMGVLRKDPEEVQFYLVFEQFNDYPDEYYFFYDDFGNRVD